MTKPTVILLFSVVLMFPPSAALAAQIGNPMVNGRLYDAATLNEVGNLPTERPLLYWERWPSVLPPAAPPEGDL
jgi:hypothetical protein